MAYKFYFLLKSFLKMSTKVKCDKKETEPDNIFHGSFVRLFFYFDYKERKHFGNNNEKKK
jgi:predicted RNA-binding protein (virulence factor B family)